MNQFEASGGNPRCFGPEPVRSKLARDYPAPRGESERPGRKYEQCNDDLDERAARPIRYGHTAIL
jgi:hypothetical protein